MKRPKKNNFIKYITREISSLQIDRRDDIFNTATYLMTNTTHPAVSNYNTWEIWMICLIILMIAINFAIGDRLSSCWISLNFSGVVRGEGMGWIEAGLIISDWENDSKLSDNKTLK